MAQMCIFLFRVKDTFVQCYGPVTQFKLQEYNYFVRNEPFFSCARFGVFTALLLMFEVFLFYAISAIE